MDKSLIHIMILEFEKKKSVICFEDSTLIKSVIKAHFNGNGTKKSIHYITETKYFKTKISTGKVSIKYKPQLKFMFNHK